MRTWSRAVVAAALWTGCASEPAAVRAPIRDGLADLTTTVVVNVADFARGGRCTGTLIAPNLVLSALHCVAPIVGIPTCAEGTFGPPYPAADFGATTRPTFTPIPSDYHPVAEIVVPPGGDGFCGRDIVLLVLSENVAAGEAAPIAPRLDTAPASGETYTAIGYGGTDDVGSDSDVRRRREGLVVDCVPPAPECDWLVEPEWLGEAGVCPGDSGGPAIDGAGAITGVASRGAVGCVSPTYVGLTTYADWLRAEGARAAARGGYEPPPWVGAVRWDGGSPIDAGAPRDGGPDDAGAALLDAADARPIDAAPAPAPGGGGCAASRATAPAWWALVVLACARRRPPRSPPALVPRTTPPA